MENTILIFALEDTTDMNCRTLDIDLSNEEESDIERLLDKYKENLKDNHICLYSETADIVKINPVNNYIHSICLFDGYDTRYNPIPSPMEVPNRYCAVCYDNDEFSLFKVVNDVYKILFFKNMPWVW